MPSLPSGRYNPLRESLEQRFRRLEDTIAPVYYQTRDVGAYYIGSEICWSGHAISRIVRIAYLPGTATHTEGEKLWVFFDSGWVAFGSRWHGDPSEPAAIGEVGMYLPHFVASGPILAPPPTTPPPPAASSGGRRVTILPPEDRE